MNTASAKIMPFPLWIYVLVWVFFIYIFVNILKFTAEIPGNPILSGMYFIEFGVHELSHIVMMFMSPIVTATAGSVGEISFTMLMVFAAIKSRAYFAACFAGLWLMLALRSVGLYISDARAQQLPLIGPGETVQHDWHFILGELGWLGADGVIGGAVIGVGVLIGGLSLVVSACLIVFKFTRD